jgi:glycosyltransferase involved in cell wall biosynthesis
MWERNAAARSGAVVCVSEEERALGAASRIPRLRVIENGVDTRRFLPQTETDRTAARARHGLADEPTVVCVAIFRYQKGQDLLVAAWPQVRVEVPGARLILVGDGPFRREVEELAGPGVSFVGHQDEVVSWLATADVVAVPSRWDGMSLSLLEAMACGRSIVATDCPGVERVLDGCGAVVPVEDGGALATAIVERLIDPIRTEVEAAIARRRVEESFDFRRVTKQMNEVYDAVLRDQP